MLGDRSRLASLTVVGHPRLVYQQEDKGESKKENEAQIIHGTSSPTYRVQDRNRQRARGGIETGGATLG